MTKLNKDFSVNPEQLNILRNAVDYYLELHDEIIRTERWAGLDTKNAREVRDTCEQILSILRTR